jgi:hypothetical protein
MIVTIIKQRIIFYVKKKEVFIHKIYINIIMVHTYSIFFFMTNLNT